MRLSRSPRWPLMQLTATSELMVDGSSDISAELKKIMNAKIIKIILSELCVASYIANNIASFKILIFFQDNNEMIILPFLQLAIILHYPDNMT